MAWTWKYLAADGAVAGPAEPAEDFGSQGDAESWIGEEWKTLKADGVDRVVLLEDGAEIYTMSLQES
ncbi:hypothetical protein [Kitasatospora viridis]|uniref:Uncharacterized protein n=1 Tax=Kitasatospora viridis TaxID=281105 RepID=A0A561ULX8_9ACTN|nr:hypothetical protein [Kitasatospora viridis]TWG00383.1 hypothetical protein FHX73_114258 [Kitasatospora viridis]